MCPACIEAAERLSHSFHDCPGCRARAVSRDPRFFESSRGGFQTPAYRYMLEQAQVTHEQVKEAADADALGRVTA